MSCGIIMCCLGAPALYPRSADWSTITHSRRQQTHLARPQRQLTLSLMGGSDVFTTELRRSCLSAS